MEPIIRNHQPEALKPNCPEKRKAGRFANVSKLQTALGFE
jgi:hypothetical protein